MDPQIRALLDRVPGWQAHECSVSVLKGGITNSNYKVLRRAEAFVLRVGGEGTSILGIDRHRELRASRAAATCGVGAEVVAFLEPEGVLVTHFIEGSAITTASAAQPETLRRVAHSIRLYHSGAAVAGEFWAPEVVRNYHALARDRGVAFPDSLPQVLALVAEMERGLGRPQQPVPCHNDLLASNLIDDGRTIRILDWEYAGMGDAFFDLGNFAVNQRLEAAGRETLLAAYLGRVHDADRAHLELMRLLSDLREAFWGFLQSGVSRLEFDFRGYALEHFERFEKNAASPEVGEWIEAVRRKK